MKITGSGIDMFQINNTTVQRLSFTMYHNGTAPINFDYSKVRVQVVLNRNGKKITICSGQLGVLARESMFRNGYEAANNGDSGYALIGSSDILVPLVIDFGSPINLKGSDYLETEVDAVAGWYGTGTTPGNCWIEALYRPTIGIEYNIPQINVSTVKSGASEHQISLGDNVISVSLISQTNTTLTIANQQLVNFKLDSDRYTVNDTFYRALGRRLLQFDYQVTANKRYHSFRYEPETEIDDAQLDLTLNAANIGANTHFVVWRTFLNDYETLNRASMLENKHSLYDQKKLQRQVSGK